MEFDQLRGFYHVARLGSFTAAAAKLFVTQPAISHQVKALEREVGEHLFDRVGRTVRLTHAGRLLYEQVEDLLGRIDDLSRTMRELRGVKKGRLVIGASDTTSMYFLPDLLKKYLEAHPGIEVEVTSLMSRWIVKKVLERDVDVGLVALPARTAGVEVLPLFAERLTCITRAGHPLASRCRLGAPDLAGLPFVALEKGSITRERVEDFFSGAGLEWRPKVELSNFEVIKRFVAAGLGFSIVPEAVVRDGAGGIVAVPLDGDLTIGVGAIFRREKSLSHCAREFLSLATEHFRCLGCVPGALRAHGAEGATARKN